MQRIDELLQESGADAAAIGAQHGLSGDQTRQAMASLMPFVMGGFQKKAEAGDHEEVANLAGGIGDPATAVQPGNAILGNIFGSKDVSRQVAARAGGQSGIPDSVMKALLPIVAAMVGRHLTKKMGGGIAGGLGGAILGSVLGGLGGNGQQLPGGGMTPAGGAASPGGGMGGALGGMLDRNGDGNPLDDILGGLMGGRR